MQGLTSRPIVVLVLGVRQLATELLRQCWAHALSAIDHPPMHHLKLSEVSGPQEGSLLI